MNFTEADLTHPWAAADGLRIPLVDTTHPRIPYEVALVAPGGHPEAILPTDAEAQVIASFIDFRRAYYTTRYANLMLERQFDIDDSTNTVVLLCTENGWRYRKASWTGPELVGSTSPDTAAGLVDILDRHQSFGGVVSPRWAAWKSAHQIGA